MGRIFMGCEFPTEYNVVGAGAIIYRDETIEILSYEGQLLKHDEEKDEIRFLSVDSTNLPVVVENLNPYTRQQLAKGLNMKVSKTYRPLVLLFTNTVNSSGFRRCLYIDQFENASAIWIHEDKPEETYRDNSLRRAERRSLRNIIQMNNKSTIILAIGTVIMEGFDTAYKKGEA